MKINTDNMRKRIIIIMLVVLAGVFTRAAAQPTSTRSNTPFKIKSNQWQNLCSDQLVTVSYKYANCELPSAGTHHENVYLQLTNLTDKEVKIEWDIEYWYAGKCNGCDPANTENHKSIILEPGQTIAGSCSEKCDPSLVLLSKMLDMEGPPALSNFNIRDLKSSEIANASTK